MGDVLPPKRETVVDRLKVRLDQYRWHHKSSLHRYEQNANSLNEKNRQDTIRLKQKFLETNAKKAKNNKTDHHRASAAARDAIPDTQKLLSHPKPVAKTVEVSSPANHVDSSIEDTDRKSKITLSESTVSELVKEQPKTPNFPLKIASQFSKNNKSNLPKKKSGPEKIQVAVSPASQNVPQVPTQPISQNIPNLNQNKNNPADDSCNIECKREVDNVPDICQFKDNTTSCTGSDRLSDTFPSIGFAEDSGDDIIHPDILKNLIDDVFTNSADFMKEFNFADDNIDGMKDSGKDDIAELVKNAIPRSAFQSENLVFSGHSLNADHQTGSSIFETPSAASSSSNIPSMAATTTTTAASTTNNVLYRSHQGLQNFSNANNLGLSSGMNMDFKLSEPSPAALTLKQMAEQHQNMQQKQHQLNSNLNSSFNVRNQFNLNSFSEPVNNFGTRFVNGPAERIQSSGMYQPMTYEVANNYRGVVPQSNNSTFKQEMCGIRPNSAMISNDSVKHQMIQMAQTSTDKKMSPASVEGVNFYSVNPSNQQYISPSQYIRNVPSNNVQLQMRQTPQLSPVAQSAIRPIHIQSSEMKPTDNIHAQYSNMYAYNPQQNNSTIFNIPQNSHYNAVYNIASSGNRPPPEYKMPDLNNRTGNVPMNQSRLQASVPYQQVQQAPANNWWVNQQQQQNLVNTDLLQNQDGYANLNCTGPIPSTISHTTLHHPYRTMGKTSSPGITNMNHNHSMLQNHQLNPQQHRSSTSSMDMNLGNSPGIQMYSGYPDFGNRQENQLNLDFLDTMESSASDLLNFDQVMQNTGTTHFQLLDDMDMLTK